MRVWKFFKKPKKGEEIPDSVTIEDRYPLYAITNNPQLAEDFKRIHNMSRFVVRIVKGVSQEEYKRYGNTYRGAVLKYGKLLTYQNGDKIYIEIPITELEDTVIQEPYVRSVTDEKFWNYIPICPVLFGKKYFEALKLINFVKMYSITHGLPISSDDDDDDYSFPEIILDELQLYIDTFNDILI